MSERRSVEAHGSTVEEAIARGLAQLQLAREDVIVEILEEGRKGLLGLGSREAVVRLTPLSVPRPHIRPQPEGEATTESVAEEPAAGAPVSEEPLAVAEEALLPEPESPDEEAVVADEAVVEERAPVAEEPASIVEAAIEEAPEALLPEETEAAAPEAPAAEEEEDEEEAAATAEEAGEEAAETADVAREIVRNLLDRMGFGDAQISVRHSEPDDKTGRVMTMVEVEGENLAGLIGPGGDTLNDLQYLARLMAGHALRRRANFVVDVAGFRRRRREALKKLAQRMADKAVKRGEAVTLEPMSAYDRRIIHMALRDDERVYTSSVGEGASRRVRVYLQE